MEISSNPCDNIVFFLSLFQKSPADCNADSYVPWKNLLTTVIVLSFPFPLSYNRPTLLEFYFDLWSGWVQNIWKLTINPKHGTLGNQIRKTSPLPQINAFKHLVGECKQDNVFKRGGAGHRLAFKELIPLGGSETANTMEQVIGETHCCSWHLSTLSTHPSKMINAEQWKYSTVFAKCHWQAHNKWWLLAKNCPEFPV